MDRQDIKKRASQARKPGRKEGERRNGKEGMMTVESSVIVPLLTILIVILLFFSLFLLDMMAVKSEAIRLANETASSWKTDGELATGEYQAGKLLTRKKRFLLSGKRGSLEKKARRRLKKRISKRITISSVGKCRVKIHDGKVAVTVSMGFSIPFNGGKKYAGMSGWQFSCTENADINNEEEWLREKAAEQLAAH